MKEMDYIEILKIVGTVLGAGGVLGGIVAFLSWTSTNRKVNADVVVTFADGWQKLAADLERRLKELEEKYEKSTAKHERDISALQKAHKEELALKDKEIVDLNKRIDDLEGELAQYRKIGEKTQAAKDTLHHTVEESIDSITTPKQT